MDDDLKDILLLAIGGMTAFIVMVVAMAFIVSHFDAASMREVGYEAKAIKGSCYAKFKDRWVSCDTVVNNQINVTKD